MKIEIAIRQDTSGKWLMWHVWELVEGKIKTDTPSLDAGHTHTKDFTPEDTAIKWLQQYLDEH